MLARLIRSPLLSAAIVSLAIFAGSAASPWLSTPHHSAPKQIDDAAFQRELDRAMAEGGVSDPLPFVVPTVPVEAADAAIAPAPAHAELTPVIETPVHAEAKTEVKQAADNSIKTPAEIKHRRTTKHAARPLHRRPAARRSDGLNAMAAISGNDLIAEARKYLGGNPTGWSSEWCGRFLDMVLKKTGHKGGGNLARGYLKYGKRLPGPQVGAIAVFSRRGGGHVGIVTGVDSNGNPIVISGNYNDRVAIATYPASRVLGYVDPD
jgi:uncharacterized protein (TIGR02594 family)